MTRKGSTLLLGLIPTLFLSLWFPVKLYGGIFRGPKVFPGGDFYSNALAAGDFNGDGDIDLVVASSRGAFQPGTVSILLGDGKGNFTLTYTYAIDGAASLAIGDLNGDRKLDIVVGSEASLGAAYVLLGNGDGSFAAPQVFETGGYYTAGVALADLNHDGKLDLVATNLCKVDACGGDHVVGVLLGNGDGTFKPAVAYDSGGGGMSGGTPFVAAALVVADVNGDRKPDVLVANEDGRVGVLLGKGDGTLAAVHTYVSGGVGATAIAVADLNGDKKPDLAVVNNNTICVLLGTGKGIFAPPQAYPTTGAFADGVAIADVNRDGKLDLAVSNADGYIAKSPVGVVDVFLGNGDGTFQASERYNSGGLNGFGVIATDVNGDQKPDLVAVNLCGNAKCSAPGTIGVLLNQSVWATTTTLTSSPNPSVHGAPVTFTATVASVGTIPPTGKVFFKNGGTAFASADLNNGKATVTKGNLPAGTLSITAVYSGDTQSGKSTSPVLTQVVNP